jgi:Secretion system C-terminal sorting domain/Carboxypeptidase regulatory-like domain
MKIFLIILLIAVNSLFCDTIWDDDFEVNSGWLMSGEFEIGSPQGLGGEYGNPDPDAAFAGLQVLGVDLTGTGGYSGDYENSLGEDEYYAVSPLIDCSLFLNIEFSFMKWLNVEHPDYDHASIDVSSDDGTTWVEIWTNVDTVADDDWIEDIFDISAIADLQSIVRIRFTIGPTDGSWQYSGWNIDNLIVSGDPVVYGTIEGNVVNSANNQPVAFAQISSQFGNALSNEEGYFLMTEIPTGNRTITINALGFYSYESEDVLVIENDTIYVLCELIENPDVPPSPQNLTAEIIDENSVQLLWDAPDDILLAYNVYRNGYIMASVLEENHLDLELVNGIYQYFVTAVYDVGESLPSNLLEVEIDAIGSTNNEIIPLDAKLWNYPNPFNPSTTISFGIKENEEGILEIYNLLGQIILKETFKAGEHQYHWNAEGLASGIYLYRLKACEFDISRKCLLLR